MSLRYECIGLAFGRGRGWLIGVSDAAATRSPAPPVDRDPAQGGLGLHLVVALSSTHGRSVRGDRKHVWACLPRQPVA
jgi:hypothetical protein